MHREGLNLFQQHTLIGAYIANRGIFANVLVYPTLHIDLKTYFWDMQEGGGRGERGCRQTPPGYGPDHHVSAWQK